MARERNCRMTEWYREAFDEFYLDVYSHRDEKEADEFASFLSEMISLEGLAVLDVCCGEGRHLRAFEREGAVGFGLDLSTVLLERLQAAGEGGCSRIVRGDMRDFPFKSESFDLCTNMFTSLGYFETREEESRVLREAWRVLRPEGVFVIDHVNPVWVESTLEPRTVKTKGDLLIEERRRMVDEGKAVEKTMTIRSVKAPEVPLRDYRERVALFRTGELEQMLEEAGFGIVKLLGSYDGRPFQEASSSRLIVLVRKP
jgi:SAM-dependent methyltransferase